MDLDDQFEIEHLFLTERKCRTCKIKKNLIESFYKIRKKILFLHHILMNVKNVP